MKPLVIYHDQCTDGFGAAFAAWLKFGEEAEYLPMNYGKVPGDEEFLTLIQGREVYILDFSLPKDMMSTLFAFAARAVWLDHHKSAFEMWAHEIFSTPHLKGTDYIEEGDSLFGTHSYWVQLDNNKSGALLAWEYFHPGVEVPMLIRHIDDRDRWQFKLEGTKEFHAALASYQPWSFEQWDEFASPIKRDGKTAVDSLVLEGETILRAHNQNVQSVAKQARKCHITKPGVQRGPRVVPPWQHRIAGPNHLGYYDEAFVVGLAANCPAHLASDVGHALATQSGTYGLIWYMGQDGKAKLSFRSNGEYDVSAIAKAFGGGGHRNAAGCEVDMGQLLSWFR